MDRRIYYVDSANRTSGTSTDFTITLPVPTDAPWDKVTLLECSIPQTYFLVVAPSNTMLLQEGAKYASVAIPPGNYSIESFAIVAGNALTASSPNGYTYAATWAAGDTSAFNGILTYTSTAGLPAFIFPPESNLHEQFGFASASTNAFTLVSGVPTLVGTQISNFTNDSVIYVHLDACSTGYDDTLEAVYQQNTTVLSYLFYQSTEAELHAKDLTTNRNNGFGFRLTDSTGTVIDLGGNDWNCTLLCFQENKFTDRIESLIRLLFAGHDGLSVPSAILDAERNPNAIIPLPIGPQVVQADQQPAQASSPTGSQSTSTPVVDRLEQVVERLVD